MFKYIADSATVTQGAGNDDITNILRTLIFTTLEISSVLVRLQLPQYLVESSKIKKARTSNINPRLLIQRLPIG
jgi:hypothetical protein